MIIIFHEIYRLVQRIRYMDFKIIVIIGVVGFVLLLTVGFGIVNFFSG